MNRTVRYVFVSFPPSCSGSLASAFLSLSSSTPARFFGSLLLVLENIFVRNNTIFIFMLFFSCSPTSATNTPISYTVFSMRKAERRRCIELHHSQDHDIPGSLPHKTKSKKKIKHRKSVSSESDDNVIPFPPYRQLLEEDQSLLSWQNSYYDDHDTDNDSADWEWEKSMTDGVAEATSTTSLFGAGQWSSTWPSKAVMDIMNAVNVSELVSFMVTWGR